MTAHATLGASNAHRWLVCAGSVDAERDIPNTSSPFAEEGTRAHDLAELSLRTSGAALDAFADQDMAEFVRVYVDYVTQAANESELFEIEQRVDYSDWIEGGFGTADAVIVKGGVIHVCDLKYGMGVRVDAENNPQGMLYALGAYAANSYLGDIHTAKISIIQPRLDHISEWEIAIPDLLRWAEWAKQRAEETAEPDAPRTPGEKQCRFCRAKASCQALKAFTEDAILCEFEDLDNIPKANTLTDAQMRKALEAKPVIESWLSAIETLVKQRLEGGDGFDGYKLVEGRSNRQWSDEWQAAAKLIELVGNDKAYSAPKLISPSQAEKVLGKKRAGEIADLVSKPRGAPTLAHETDKRPAINVSLDDFNDCTE